MGGRDRYSFNCWKARTHSSIHSNPFHLFSNWKKGLHLSAYREMNRFNAAFIPISFWTSLGFHSGCKSLITLIWSRLTSIPKCVTMYPKNFPNPTPKEHLEALRRSLCLLNILKISLRSLTCLDSVLLFTTISSI